MITHRHLLVNGDTNLELKSCRQLEAWLKHLVQAISMKVIIEPRAAYADVVGNRGITAQIGIETSHIAMHVWDERQPSLVQFDLYTCGPLDVELVLTELENGLGLFNYKYIVLERGEGFAISGEGHRE